MVQVQVWSNAVMTRKVHWWRRLESIRERKLAGLIEHNFSRLVLYSSLMSAANLKRSKRDSVRTGVAN
ncbi:hypothetical protein T02_15433 [Trichinella nativa]|uniref:Uncharacterized protein n=1 Tax=Trichinella nativa TaxID=6335 RepID=A0A0V1L482_9BILA|nr:hypothetical protein T02_15433 [Trichinella nativa]